MKKQVIPKFVIYINVGNLSQNKVDKYTHKVIKRLNIKDAVYIPTREKETGIYKISEENRAHKYDNFEIWLEKYKNTDAFKKDGRGFAYPIIKEAFLAGREKI